MSQVLEERNFTDGRTGCSFFVLQPDLLQCYQVVRQTRFALVDRGVGSLNDLENYKERKKPDKK